MNKLGEYVEQAAPGPWFVGSCRTWTEEQKVLAILPLLMDLYAQSRRALREGNIDDFDLESAIYRLSRMLER